MSGLVVLPPRRNDDGVHLCTAVDGCDGIAVIQWAADCDCDGHPESHTHPVFACADHEVA